MWSYILMISLLSEIGRLDFFNIKLWFFVCSGLILSSSQTPIHPLAQSPAEWGGKRRKIRVMDLNDYNLINKAERWIHSLLTVCGQLSDHFLKNTTSIGVTGALEDKHHNHQHSLLSSSPHQSYGMGSAVVSCPHCVPSWSLAHSQSSLFRVEEKKPWYCASTDQQ